MNRVWCSLSFGKRVALIWLFSGTANFALQSPAWRTWLRDRVSGLWAGIDPGEAAYLAFVIGNLLIGLMLILFVLAIIKLERPRDIRQFFKIGPIDWPGIGLIAILTILLNILEGAFLRRMVYEPIRTFLLSHGFWGSAATDAGFTPDPKLAVLNILLLLLIIWIEAPEEIIFRGYIQNHFQGRIGMNAAAVAGAFIWAVWHLFDVAEIVRILIFGLALSLVFRLRQNTTPLAIWHPLGNRLLLLASILTVFGR